MTARDQPALAGRRQLAADVSAAVEDLRATRVELGLSQAAVARAAGISQARLSRIERGVVAQPRVEALAATAGVLGMRLRLNLYPEGQPLRDRVQTPGLASFRKRLHPAVAWRTEVPLPAQGDSRAWDAVVIDDEHVWTGIEWISRIGAVDATLRRSNLKLRDDPRVSRLVLVVADTTRNREALRAAIGIVRAGFPLDTRAVLASLGEGHAPPLNGIVLVRVPADRPHPVHSGGKVVDGGGPRPRRFVENPVGAMLTEP